MERQEKYEKQHCGADYAPKRVPALHAESEHGPKSELKALPIDSAMS
jgi:hypothetical protein